MPLAPQQSFALAPPAANTGLALLVNGYDRTASVVISGAAVHLSGTNAGTLDATLVDPAAIPAGGDLAVAFNGTLQVFEGRVQSVDVTEHRLGPHVFARFAASDYGPQAGLPTAPPWNVSDTGTGGTHAYGSLKQQTRVAGGAATTSWQLDMAEDGLWQGMQVQVTSALLGLSAAPLNIVDTQLGWTSPSAPH